MYMAVVALFGCTSAGVTFETAETAGPCALHRFELRDASRACFIHVNYSVANRITPATMLSSEEILEQAARDGSIDMSVGPT